MRPDDLMQRRAQLQERPLITQIDVSDLIAQCRVALPATYDQARQIAQRSLQETQQQLARAQSELSAHEVQRMTATDVRAWAEGRRVLVDTVQAFAERVTVAQQRKDLADLSYNQALAAEIDRQARTAKAQCDRRIAAHRAAYTAKEAELKALEREQLQIEAVDYDELQRWRDLAQRHGVDGLHLMTTNDRRRLFSLTHG